MSGSNFVNLFKSVPHLGLEHRIVMAPLTRVRGTQTFACGEGAVKYYSERASHGGLLITEGAPISPETQYEYAAGIYTKEQEDSWKKVVDAVHAKGGKISIQLWHLGRMVHSSWSQNEFLRSLGRPLPTVSASATAAPGMTRDVKGQSRQPYLPARALEREEIYGRLVDDYRKAAQAAKRAGFDMVEIHAAHGYLFDQFFCDSTNLRTDEFGAQNTENRTRALGLVLKAVIEVFGNHGVGIRISPAYKDTFAFQGCKDSNPEKTYREVIAWLDQFKLGYLLITEMRWNGGRENSDVSKDPTYSFPVRGAWIRSVYKGFVIGSSSFLPSTGEKAMADGTYDAIAFGRFFISNPDFVERARRNLPLNVYNTSTFYVRDQVVGYTDYPTWENRGNFPVIDPDLVGKATSKL